MTNLTEKWKQGKLPCGWYYIKIIDIIFIDFFEGKKWKNYKDKYIDEVLAEVLSYEEYINCKDCLKLLWEAAQKEFKLKELLKECREVINWQTENYDEKPLVSKIDKLLQENEE